MQCDTEQIEVIVNGDPFKIDAGANLARLVEIRKPQPPFAAEVNKIHVRRTEFDRTPLNAGDRIEIVTLVGGG